MSLKKMLEHFRVPPGTRFRVKDHDTAFVPKQFRHLKDDALKDGAKSSVEENLATLAKAQERLYANDVYSLLIIFQAMDAAGKDGMIKHVMSGLNPQGCQVFSFKQPSAEELDHNFLWRYSRDLPERGRIGIFNRSYYEETLVVRVHPEIVERQRLPPGPRDDTFWAARYEDINHFEKHLSRNGTMVLKFFLNISKKEQKKRFLDRLTDPEKYWKFSSADLNEREFWDDYMEAFEDTITATSTKRAPWYVIPADHKWIGRAIVSAAITDAIGSLALRPPEVTPARLKELAAARRRLAAER